MRTIRLLTSLSIAMTLTTAPAMGQTRVCRLLKLEDVNAVFASTFMQGEATRTPTGDGVCPFMNAKEYGVSIALVEKGGAERFTRKQAQFKRSSHVTTEDIAGLGDKALYTHTASIGEITVKTQGTGTPRASTTLVRLNYQFIESWGGQSWPQSDFDPANAKHTSP